MIRLIGNKRKIVVSCRKVLKNGKTIILYSRIELKTQYEELLEKKVYIVRDGS